LRFGKRQYIYIIPYSLSIIPNDTPISQHPFDLQWWWIYLKYTIQQTFLVVIHISTSIPQFNPAKYGHYREHISYYAHLLLRYYKSIPHTYNLIQANATVLYPTLCFPYPPDIVELNRATPLRYRTIYPRAYRTSRL